MLVSHNRPIAVLTVFNIIGWTRENILCEKDITEKSNMVFFSQPFYRQNVRPPGSFFLDKQGKVHFIIESALGFDIEKQTTFE